MANTFSFSTTTNRNVPRDITTTQGAMDAASDGSALVPGENGTNLPSVEKSNSGSTNTSAAGTAISASLSLPTDPLLAQQWHLGNTGGLLDLNVRGVWNPTEGLAYTGAGTRSVVIDNGFDYNHQDFDNYDQSLDYDYDQADLDPFGNSSDAHGTAVAGIIGAAADGTGAVGVAHGTSLIGYRTNNFISDFWLQNIRDAIRDAAMGAGADLANISQGIANDAASEFGAGYNAVRFDEIEASIGTAVNSGRGGLGMTIVKSAGNSRADDYDVNADDWSNDTRQVVVGAVDQNGFVSSYSSYGAALLVSGFGTPGQVVTTDRSGAAGYNATDFTSGFNGTSAAAPMVSGVVSLMYDANAALGWRDVQTILGASARQVGSEVGAGIAGSERYGWQFNGAKTWNGGGQHFSNDYGYGLVDAHASVRLAESWLLTGTAAATSSNQFTNTIDALNSAVVIPDGNATGLTFSGNAFFDDIVERVTVQMSFSTTYLADVELYLTSPNGTVSELIDDVAGNADFNGTWTFESQAFRGERAAGAWSVRVVDDAGADVLTVSDVVIQTLGAYTTDDRYIYTNEYSDYSGSFGHVSSVTDSNGGTDTVNASAVTTGSTIRLDGGIGAIDGVNTSFSNVEHAIGGDGNDNIVGSTGNNQLYGMRGNDTLNGGSGTDTLRGSTGNDSMNGGLGTDTAIYDDATSGVTVSLLLTTAQLTGGAGTDTLLNIENLSGSSFADRLTGNTSANLILGLEGNDSLTGNAGNDTLLGGAGNDSIVGGDGNDWLRGEAGTDTILGGNGNDNILSDGDGGRYFGDAGNDIMMSGLGNETMDGGAGVDTIDHSAWAGDYTYNMTTGTTDWAFELYTNFENVIMGSGNDLVTGSTLANTIMAGDGNDTVNSGGGIDWLYGGNGNDILDGGLANDMIIGGGGSDRFRFSSTLGASNLDSIIDFSLGDGDSFQLAASIFTTLGAPGILSPGAFGLGDAAFEASQRILYDVATGLLSYDGDGNGVLAKVNFAQLTPGLAINHDSFAII